MRPDYCTVRSAPVNHLDRPMPGEVLSPHQVGRFLLTAQGGIYLAAEEKPCGRIKVAHDGFNMHLAGDTWWARFGHTPDAFRSCIGLLQHQAMPTCLSLARVDWAEDYHLPDRVATAAVILAAVGDHLESVAEQCARRLAHLYPRRAIARQVHKSITGYTVEVGFAGNDPSKMRARSHMFRIYYHVKRPTTYRVEVELKKLSQLPGKPKVLEAQWRAAEHEATVLLESEPTTKLLSDACPVTPPPSSDATTIFARLMGLYLGFQRRHGVTYEGMGYRDLSADSDLAALVTLGKGMGIDSGLVLDLVDKARAIGPTHRR